MSLNFLQLKSNLIQTPKYGPERVKEILNKPRMLLCSAVAIYELSLYKSSLRDVVINSFATKNTACVNL